MKEMNPKSILEIRPLMANLVPKGNQVDSPADDGSQRKKVYLHPGQIHASSEPSTITTILGSCVAVCLWDPVTRVGGANHYILPKWPGEGSVPKRYGDTAIRELLQEILAAGAPKERLQAKIFGGACIFKSFQGSRDMHFGQQNVTIARSALRAVGVHIVTEDVGGNHGRRMIFQTDTGDCLIKRL